MIQVSSPSHCSQQKLLLLAFTLEMLCEAQVDDILGDPRLHPHYLEDKQTQKPFKGTEQHLRMESAV